MLRSVCRNIENSVCLSLRSMSMPFRDERICSRAVSKALGDSDPRSEAFIALRRYLIYKFDFFQIFTKISSFFAFF